MPQGMLLSLSQLERKKDLIGSHHRIAMTLVCGIV